MPAERLGMRKIREVLRLHFHGRTGREIARSVHCARATAAEYIRRAQLAGMLDWNEVLPLSDDELEGRLFPPIEKKGPTRAFPDFQYIHGELRRPGVTLELLWQEYRTEHPDGYGRSRFSGLYRDWSRKLSLVMRQTHRAGEKAFVDYCDGLPLTDPKTGAVTMTQLFVGTLGASSYTYAEATLGQTLPEWLGSHVRMYKFFGGVPTITVPDNLKSGVKSADLYEPEINPAYQELAIHYNTCVIPARVRRPRDKAKVETSVLVVQRWVMARLRNKDFHFLYEINEAIRGLLGELNERIMRHRGKSRRELWEAIDRPALGPLPERSYEFAEILKCRVNIDYHIQAAGHFYSVPYQLVHSIVEVRLTAHTVEILHKSQRIASHVRSREAGQNTTNHLHMSPSHRAHAEWTPGRIRECAAAIGPSTAQVVDRMLEKKSHVELAYRSSLGVIRLERKFGRERLELAAAKAISLNSVHYRTIKSMLENGMEGIPLEQAAISVPEENLAPENVRGQEYYA